MACKDQRKEARAVLRGAGICHGAWVQLYAERGHHCGRETGAPRRCGHSKYGRESDMWDGNPPDGTSE